MEEKEKKSGMKRGLKNIKDIFQGEMLLKLGLEKYFFHVVILAVASACVMLFRSGVENTQIKREKLKAEVNETRIRHSQKEIELVGLGRMSTVEKLLEENNVNVGKPSKPAKNIKK